MSWREVLAKVAPAAAAQISQNPQNARVAISFDNCGNYEHRELMAERTVGAKHTPPAEMLEAIAERTAIIEHDGGEEIGYAEVAAIRLVQCRSCAYCTSEPLSDYLGQCRCALPSDRALQHPYSVKAKSHPGAPQFCPFWEKVS